MSQTLERATFLCTYVDNFLLALQSKILSCVQLCLNVDFMCNLSGSGRYHNDVGGMLPLIFNLMQICVALVHGFKAISHQLSQKIVE